MTPVELQSHIEKVARSGEKLQAKRGSILVFRSFLSPVDMYCYLRARFDKPNGIQSLLRFEDSDNLFHWDYHLVAGDADIYICGTSRDVHFRTSECLADKDWPTLASAIKADFSRVAKEKAAVFSALEKWIIFPNRYVEIANICGQLHAELIDGKGDYRSYAPTTRSKRAFKEAIKHAKQLSKRASNIYRNCIELSLLTPIMCESFINMLIVVLCRREIRDNQRQYESFIRSQIDTKIFDLPYKCHGFIDRPDADSPDFKNFKRIMDRRNSAIHGNVNPEREKLEVVYFDKKIPLFKDPGDHISRFFDTLERQHDVERVIRDYENMHMFQAYILSLMNPHESENIRRILYDPYPGYDVSRKITGALFANDIVNMYIGGLRYDDELSLDWQ